MQVQPVQLQSTAPWKHTAIHVDITLSHLISKKQHSVEMMKALTLSTIDAYSEYIAVYTDGSIDESGRTACSYHIPTLGIAVAARLTDDLCVYTTELTDITIAVDRIIELNPTYMHKYAIFSDSLSVLTALSNHTAAAASSLNFNNLINKLNKLHTSGKLIWIPGRVQVEGNEVADNLAKLALNN